MFANLIGKAALGGIVAGNLVAAAVTVLFYAWAQNAIGDGAVLAVATGLCIGGSSLLTTAAAILIFALLRPESPLSEALGITRTRGYFGLRSSVVGFGVASFATGVALLSALLLQVSGINLMFLLIVTFVSAFVPASMLATASGYLWRNLRSARRV